MMRNLFILVVLLLAAFMAGWFKVQRDGERTMIEINRTEIRSDARQAIDRGREFLDGREGQQYFDQQGNQVWSQEQVATQPDPWHQPAGGQYDNQYDIQYDNQNYNYGPQQPYYPSERR